MTGLQFVGLHTSLVPVQAYLDFLKYQNGLLYVFRLSLNKEL